MTPRWYRVAMFVFAVAFSGLGVWSLADGEYARCAFYLVLGATWLLMALFRDRLAPRYAATLERQRARVKGQGAISFQPDSDSRSQNK